MHTYTVIIDENENEKVEEYKKLKGHKTATKAFKGALFSAIEIEGEKKALEAENERLRIIHLNLLESLSRAANELHVVIEAVGQKSLFSV